MILTRVSRTLFDLRRYQISRGAGDWSSIYRWLKRKVNMWRIVVPAPKSETLSVSVRDKERGRDAPTTLSTRPLGIMFTLH